MSEFEYDIESSHNTEISHLAYRIIMGAFRLSDRKSRARVGTQHLLLALTKSVLSARLLMGSKMRRLKHMVMDDLSSQAEKGAGGNLEIRNEEAKLADAILREAQWRSRGIDRSNPHFPYWTPGLRIALSRAFLATHLRGANCMSLDDLVHGIFWGQGNAASAFIRKLNLDVEVFLSKISNERFSESDYAPTLLAVDTLSQLGVVSSRGEFRAPALPVRFLGAIAMRASEASLILIEHELEAVRQSVRLGHKKVDTAHLLLAILEFDRQLSLSSAVFSRDDAQANRAAVLLKEAGLNRVAMLNFLATKDLDGEACRPRRRRQLRNKKDQPEWTTSAAQAADSCRLSASRAHRGAGSNHLLRAVLSQQDSTATEAIAVFGLDLGAIIEASETLD